MKYGIGVSLGVYGCGLDGVDTSNAFVELNPDGTVTMYAAWEDHGQGADMGVLVSSHETLRQAGIRPEQIKLVMNDTKTCPNAGPAGGSRSQVMSGNACRLAAENLVAAMKKEDGTFRTYDEMVAEGLATKYEGNWVTTFCAVHPIIRIPHRAIHLQLICILSSCRKLLLIQKQVKLPLRNLLA